VIVGIDASNIRAGGGITHLTRILTVAEPKRHGIERIRVWANGDTAGKLPERPWLDVFHESVLDRTLPHRLRWQWYTLPKLARERCDLLYSPGGNAPRGIHPIVTMSRNMLPFEYDELFRHKFAWMTLRLLLLRFGQGRTFQRADGLIFLTQYAHDAIRAKVEIEGEVAVIPHGVEDRFRREPRPQHPLEDYSLERPIRLLYVSIVNVYTHQWHVAQAVHDLRRRGIPVQIDFVGPSLPASLKRFRDSLSRLDPGGTYLRYHGAIPFDELHLLHEKADVFVFASSCENMPNILLEGMAAGFPIACSNRGPMPEILGEGGTYFDPEIPEEIAEAIRALLEDEDLRARCARTAFERAQEFSWKRCAEETFDFIRRVGEAYEPKT